jgi:hypothetical protein
MRTLLWILPAAVLVVGCAVADRLAALNNLQLSIERVTDVELAGINLAGFDGGSLHALDAGRLGLALARGRMPLGGVMHVAASNPSASVADFLALDWALLLDGRDTVRGTVDRPARIGAGQSASIPVRVELDLLNFIGRDAGKALDVAQALLGNGRSNVSLGLRVFPILQTPFGPLRSPVPLTLGWNGQRGRR